MELTLLNGFRLSAYNQQVIIKRTHIRYWIRVKKYCPRIYIEVQQNAVFRGYRGFLEAFTAVGDLDLKL